MLSVLEAKESRVDRECCGGRWSDILGLNRVIRGAHTEVSFHLRLREDEGTSMLECSMVVI